MIKFRFAEKILLLTIAVVLELLPLAAFSLDSDQQQPIYIESDSATYNDKTGISVLRGKVKATQGTTIITANQATLYPDQKRQIKEIIAVGVPAQYRTITDAAKPELIAIGDSINYYPASNWVEFVGNAKATQGADSFAGPQLNFNTKQKLVVSPISNKGRSRIIIQPNQK